MFRPRKRRLYTPITPPSDEEIDKQPTKKQEQPSKQDEKLEIETQINIPEKM